jgi:predicted AlkP superfamily pyrophosphatase or phosphodiesterase
VLGTDLADRLRSRTVADGYLRPDYDEYCFANVPGTAASVLGADLDRSLPDDVLDGVDTAVDTVAVLFVDAFGHEQFREASGEHAFFDRLADRGRVTPLTGMYPTETAACVTTMHTGRTPVEHGLLGWNAYDDRHDEVFQTLPYESLATGEAPELAAEDLFEGATTYERLAEQGVTSHAVQGHLGDGYSEASLAGASGRTYDSTADFALTLRRTLADAAGEDGPSYVYAYYPNVDTAAHVEGTRSDRHDAELAALSAALERELVAELDAETASSTLLLTVADHGQVDTAPEDRVDLLDDPVVDDAVERDRHGEPLVLGGPRNCHLCVRDGEREAVRSHLAERLDALVLTREEALAEDLWGPEEPSATFERRVGDLLVVSREGMTWYDRGLATGDLDLVGMHGGLHPREALVPFGAVRLDAMADRDDGAAE